jgi:hypothetical protein
LSPAQPMTVHVDPVEAVRLVAMVPVVAARGLCTTTAVAVLPLAAVAAILMARAVPVAVDPAAMTCIKVEMGIRHKIQMGVVVVGLVGRIAVETMPRPERVLPPLRAVGTVVLVVRQEMVSLRQTFWVAVVVEPPRGLEIGPAVRAVMARLA